MGDEIPLSRWFHLRTVRCLNPQACLQGCISHQEAFGLIFSGQCGAFNPLLLQCMEEIGPMLEKELKLRSLGYVTKEEIKISPGISCSAERRPTAHWPFEQERIKYQFIADMSKDILLNIHARPIY